MRMSGSWHLYRPGERWQRPAERDAGAAGHGDLGGGGVRRAGGGVPARPRARSAAARCARLARTCSRRRSIATRRCGGSARAGPRPIAEVLLDQRVVAGIGNVFKSEVLFLCGIHPDRPATTLAPTTRAGTHRHGSAADARQHRPTRRERHRHVSRAAAHHAAGVGPGEPVGLRARREAVPQVRDADRVGEARNRCALHLLVPDVPAAVVIWRCGDLAIDLWRSRMLSIDAVITSFT